MLRVLVRGVCVKEVLTSSIPTHHLVERVGGVLLRGVLAIRRILELPWGVRAREVRVRGVLPSIILWTYSREQGEYSSGEYSPEEYFHPSYFGDAAGSMCKGSARQSNTPTHYLWSYCGEYAQGKYSLCTYFPCAYSPR